MRQETRESLFFVLQQMNKQLGALGDRREVEEQELTRLNAEIAELEKRRAAIVEDLGV
jgi:hypothetical protein